MTINIVERIDDAVAVRHALVSVSDKTGLETFVPGLAEACPDIRFLSTGGTYGRLKEILGPAAGDRLTQVSDYTGQPETQGGLVKTLDFKIYLGLLTETHNEAHRGDLERTGAVPIDLVVVNLYPFEQTVARPDASVEGARGNIDIGGPCMIRAAAKNFIRVTPVVDPADYGEILGALRESGGKTSLALRFRMARKAFAHTAAYDAAISAYLAEREFAEVAGNYRKQP
jgi:phosphoribosylaminoimidazolecarboxamide formyltransferase / IMP cyclohydrolase